MRLKKLKTTLFFIHIICLSIYAESVDTVNIIGEWGGQIEYAERLEAINVTLFDVSDSLSGTITFVFDKKTTPLEDIEIIDSRLNFTCHYDKGKLLFYGSYIKDKLQGRLLVKTPRVRSLEGFFVINKGMQIEKDILFLNRLQKYSDFEDEKVDLTDKFTYMDSSNINLRKLRIDFKLDSISGNDTEMQKMINLMKWVHKILPYNGHSGKITQINSLSLLHSEKANEIGINCKMKSTLLNEVYLAMGYPSRVVHCIPMGDNYIESHFVTIVFSEEMDKWIYMDASIGAFIQNEKQQLLGIHEFREGLIKGEKISINGDAILPDFLYKHYMSKNLFRFQCNFNSGFDSEQLDKKSCYLHPKLYMKTSNQGNEIILSNPDYFWKKPNKN